MVIIMKKFISVLTLSAVILSMTACSSNGGGNKQNSAGVDALVSD